MIHPLIWLLFPENIYCAACGAMLSGGRGICVCEACANEQKLDGMRLCKQCGKPLADDNAGEMCYDCDAETHEFTHGYAAAMYAGATRALVRNMKYRNRPYIAEAIAVLMAERWRSLIDEETGETPFYDFMIHVPVSQAKLLSRGFDQAELIAEKLAPTIGMTFIKGALERVRETVPQSALTLEERKANLDGAFRVTDAAARLIRGHKVLIVDDIYTTGTTADECARALYASGATEVSIFVFAIGGDSKRDC